MSEPSWSRFWLRVFRRCTTVRHRLAGFFKRIRGRVVLAATRRALPIHTSQAFVASIDRILSAHGQASAACAIVAAEGPVLIGATGRTRLGGPETVHENSLYHIGSTQKSMTAMLVLMLAEKGLLQTSTTLKEALPHVPMRPEYARASVRDLMLSRAGILPLQRTDIEDPQVVNELWHTIPSRHPLDARAQRAAVTAYALQLPSITPPDTEPQPVYSNVGWAILGHVIEQVLELPYEQILHSWLLQPLGIEQYKHGGWPRDDYAPSEPVGHYARETPEQPAKPQTAGDGYRFPDWMNPAGGLNLNIDSFARYAQEHLLGLQGKSALLTQTSYRQLHVTQVEADAAVMYRLKTPQHGPALKLGYGWGIETTDAGPLSSADGSGGTYYARLLIYPPLGLAFAGLANDGSGSVVLNQVVEAATGYSME